jgi:DNA-binding PucR family transcriptional regulator
MPVGTELARRLREKRAEIEGAILARAYAVASPSEVDDPEYELGLKEAVATALDFAIDAIAAGGQGVARIPERLLVQAGVAARNGVRLDTVLRRYSAGYMLLGDHLLREAEIGDVPAEELKQSLRVAAATFDQLVTAVSRSFSAEAEARPDTAARRRAEQVRMLLDGEPVDQEELHYRLDAWHLAAIACGQGAGEVIRALSCRWERALLLVPSEPDVVWAWLGGGNRLNAKAVLRTVAQCSSPEVSLALGEAGRGIEGWRLSHRQAKAAIAVARRAPESHFAYGEVALLASALRDEVLASSLRDIYLAPLEGERDGGLVLRETLSAYFAAGRNVSSTAASLGVNRKTVSLRLRSVEMLIGSVLNDCAAELETALRLEVLR